MPSRTPLSRPTDRRDDIVAQAARLMQEKGYGGISVQEIADALGFSKANFFYHLGSKQNLLHAIFVEPLRFTIANLEEIVRRDQSGEARLRAIVDLYVHLVVERAAEMQVWFKEKGHLSDVHLREVTRLERRVGQLLEDFFSEGVERGEFRDINPLLAMNGIVAMCFSLTRWPQLQRQFSRAELSAQMQQLACGALLASTGRRRVRPKR
jgi:AcrR family transcriptional regulator